MAQSMPTEIKIASPADFHAHVRQPPMSSLVVPHLSQGGVSLAYIMPNTIPPISSVDQCITYLDELESVQAQSMERGTHEVELLGTLYLSPALTPEEIRKAAGIRHPKTGRRRIVGVKSYPRGVTTNSEGGIESYDVYEEVFSEMEKQGMVLNLHGEVPSDEDKNITILNAEATFLQHLVKLHQQFPKLRIVLEHATTAAAVEAVKACGNTVGCTITPHHLQLIVDDWAGKPVNYCKPVAKTWSDRKALRDVIQEGHPRFFLGSDSAPHPVFSKLPSASTHGDPQTAASCGCAAGIYTAPILLPLCATLLESFGALTKLEGYVSTNGRAFYGFEAAKGHTITLHKAETVVPGRFVLKEHENLKDNDKQKIQIVPFWSGKNLSWSIV